MMGADGATQLADLLPEGFSWTEKGEWCGKVEREYDSCICRAIKSGNPFSSNTDFVIEVVFTFADQPVMCVSDTVCRSILGEGWFPQGPIWGREGKEKDRLPRWPRRALESEELHVGRRCGWLWAAV